MRRSSPRIPRAFYENHAPLNPADGATAPMWPRDGKDLNNKYSWVKAPRYDGRRPGLVGGSARGAAPHREGRERRHHALPGDVLAAATFMGAACRARCFGAQVLDHGDGTMERGLSPRVEAAVSLVSRAVVRHLDDAWRAGSRDLWRESGDPRALLEDARAYVRAALAACGVAGELATGMLGGVPPTMADYEADDLISKLLEGV